MAVAKSEEKSIPVRARLPASVGVHFKVMVGTTQLTEDQFLAALIEDAFQKHRAVNPDVEAVEIGDVLAYCSSCAAKDVVED